MKVIPLGFHSSVSKSAQIVTVGCITIDPIGIVVLPDVIAKIIRVKKLATASKEEREKRQMLQELEGIQTDYSSTICEASNMSDPIEYIKRVHGGQYVRPIGDTVEMDCLDFHKIREMG